MQKEKKKTKKKIPFWIQIIAILLCGVLASVCVYFAAPKDKRPEYTVTFQYQDGTIIGTKQAKEGQGVYPIEYIGDDVFRGWDRAINNITSDMETYPELYTITNEENFFFFNSQYVQEGKKFKLDLILGGDVNISKAVLTLEYDNEVLNFTKATKNKIFKITEQEDGKVVFELNSDVPLKERTKLTTLTFDALEMDAYYSQMTLSAKDGYHVSEDDEIPATLTTINNKIYFLQEVSK
ncbi:MAG TPA: hypothetical protein GXZ23_03630 [Clostridiales bacterium]|nr:hypothetical protein [Clostridiales bacterium]